MPIKFCQQNCGTLKLVSLFKIVNALPALFQKFKSLSFK